MSDASVGAVFVQTNEFQNAVIAFRRAADGTLTHAGIHETGGAGDGTPHLPSQGSVMLTGDGRQLLVTNAGSGAVTVFGVEGDGGITMVGEAAAGPEPRSVTEHDGLVYVLDAAGPAVVGLRMTDGGLLPLDGGRFDLSPPDADPAQVGFTPDGAALIVTERGTDAIVAFAVGSDGLLGATGTVASSGPTPYGFAVTGAGVLVVTEAFGAQKGAAAASTYRIRGTAITPVTKSVGNGRSEICWAVVTPDGRHAFTTNFADGAVSSWEIGADGQLTLVNATAGVSVDGRPGLRDEDLTGDGRFLYALDADAGEIFGWAVGDDGTLVAIGSWGGLPATVAGLAAM